MECPRCARPLQPPTLLRHQYHCPRHGDVAGLGPAVRFGPAEVTALVGRAHVPIWFPSPMPDNWLLTGLRWAETPRRDVSAVAVGISGPGLAKGPTDIIIVAEQPGSGMGAAFAGLAGSDPGEALFAAAASARIRTAGRTTAMWSVPAPDRRVAYVGEADGDWLWIIGWPDSAWAVVADDLQLADGRVDPSYADHARGALNPRLVDRGT